LLFFLFTGHLFTGPLVCLPDLWFVYRTFGLFTGPLVCLPDLWLLDFLFTRRLLLMSALFKAAQRNDLAGVLRELEKAVPLKELCLAVRVAVRNDCVSVVLHMRCSFTALFPALSTTWGFQNGRSLHRIAIESGSVQVMRHIFDAQRPLLPSDQFLQDACLFGHKFAAQHLVACKAVVSPQGTRFTPLYCGVGHGYAHVVIWLLQSKASLNARVGMFEKSPLAIARDVSIESPRHKLVVRLLERALQVNGRVESKT
jgi:hypothetical protein